MAIVNYFRWFFTKNGLVLGGILLAAVTYIPEISLALPRWLLNYG